MVPAPLPGAYAGADYEAAGRDGRPREGGVSVASLEIEPTDFSYTFDPGRAPIARVAPGARVTVRTEDAMNSKVSSECDLPSIALAGHTPNPLTGPIFVEGARPGDTLSVLIEHIEPVRDFAVSCFIEHMGGLTSTDTTRTLQEPLPERTWIWSLHGGPQPGTATDRAAAEAGLAPSPEHGPGQGPAPEAGATEPYLLNEHIGVRVPWRPFVGSIGVAPSLEAVASITPGPFGGNMDCPDVRPGNTLRLPVFQEGALFYLGDCHANQGQGELCGVALEIPCRVTVVIDVIKGTQVRWPRIVSDEAVMVVGSARPMEDAARIAYTELTLWLAEEFGFTRWEAYQLLTQVGRLYVANMVNPAYSLVASVERRYLQRG